MTLSLSRSDVCRLIRLCTAAAFSSDWDHDTWIRIHDRLQYQLDGWDFHQSQKKENAE